MKINRLRLLLLFALALSIGWISYLAVSPNSKSGSTENSLTKPEKLVYPEPHIAAAMHSSISPPVVRPLSFGALVSMENDSFIEMTPNGDIYASGDISGQSQFTHIGTTNLAKYSENELYKIHPGLLEFDVKDIAKDSTLKVEFITGRLQNGIELTNLSIEVGASDGLIPLPPARANNLLFSDKIEFKATKAISHSTIKLAFGGRLTLSHGHGARGKLDTSVPVRITLNRSNSGWVKCAHEGKYCRVPKAAIVRYGANGHYKTKNVFRPGVACNNHVFGDPVRGTRKHCEYLLSHDYHQSRLATVYQHVNYRGESWNLTDARVFSINELMNALGNDIISSIKVAPGYKLKACEHSMLSGKCLNFTGENSDLRQIQFNDKISSLEVIRKY